MAPRIANADELVKVAFIDTAGNRHENVSIPRRLVLNGSQAAKERWMVANGVIPDPNAPEPPAPVEVVIAEVKTDQVAAASEAVAQLQAQLAEIQSNLQGQPLSHAELVSAREEITGFLLKAADAAAQLVQVEGRGSQLKAELTAIATPLNEQAAETARQQAENAEVTTRVLSDLQAQTAAALEALAAEGAAALSEVDVNAERAAKATARTVAKDVAVAEIAKHWGAGVTIAPEDPTQVSNFGERWFGRQLIPGDGTLQTTENGLIAWRFTGDGWVRSAELLPKVVTATGPVIADRSSHTMTTQTIVRAGGGGGNAGGLEPLLINRADRGTWYTIADSSNWVYPSATRDPHSAQVYVEVVDISSGKSGVAICTIDVGDQPGNTNLTEYALTGALFDDPIAAPEVDFDGVRGGVIIPSGVVPIGAQLGFYASRIRFRVGANIGGTAGPYIVRGGTVWLRSSSATAKLADDPSLITEQPAWIWV